MCHQTVFAQEINEDNVFRKDSGDLGGIKIASNCRSFPEGRFGGWPHLSASHLNDGGNTGAKRF